VNGWVCELCEAVGARELCGKWLGLAARSIDSMSWLRSVWRFMSSDEARGSYNELMKLVAACGARS
jgi:hypothetical protein